MDDAIYQTENSVEANHWWFWGRRRLFASIIRGTGISRASPALDIGSSTGTNLRLLRDLGFADAVGVDRSERAAGYCRTKGLAPVIVADACNLPCPSGHYGLVLATDLLEHILDDVGAAREVCRVLKPGGLGIVTVPAHPALWGPHDDLSHHLRRYRHGAFIKVLQRGGLSIERSFHFNFILFPAIWMARTAMRSLRMRNVSENALTPGPVNNLLKAIFAVDVAIGQRISPPFGVSLLALVRRQDAPELPVP